MWNINGFIVLTAAEFFLSLLFVGFGMLVYIIVYDYWQKQHIHRWQDSLDALAYSNVKDIERDFREWRRR